MPERINSIDLIVVQYRAVVGALDDIFKEMGKRSEIDLWRVDGIGSCRGMDKASSESRIEGPARNRLLQLRDNRNMQFSGQASILTECPYHREGFGCVLGDLKSPYCIAHVDYPGSMKKHLRIDGYQLRLDICSILAEILTHDDASSGTSYIAINAIDEMAAYVKTQPVLKPDERTFLNYILSLVPSQERIAPNFDLSKHASLVSGIADY